MQHHLPSYRRILIALISFGLTASAVHAQMINNREGKAFDSPITFNRSFIWENKIKTITEKKVVKMTGRPIVDLNDITIYTFGPTGLLEKVETKKLVDTDPDSSSILYKRNDIGQLFLVESKKGSELNIQENIFDQTGKIKRTDIKQRIEESKDKYRDLLIESTTYEYSFPKENTIRRENINNYGLAFSAITTEKNEQGFLLSEEEEWYISKKVNKKSYHYNEKGWVEKISSSSSAGEVIDEQLEYHYDDIGNVLTAKKIVKGKAVEDYEVLYQNGALVKAILIQDLESAAITIHKYEYTFKE